MNRISRSIVSAVAAGALAINGLPVPVTSAAPEPKLIALTFDDGPNTATTNEVLDVLEEYGAVGSFFLIGDHINEESAAVVRRAYEMGCEIDNHSRTHSYMSGMSAEEIAAEVRYVDEAVFEITGEHTKFFRPPYIDVSQTMYDAIALPFICGIGCGDADSSTTAEQRAQAVISGARDGQIVLLHDFYGNTKTVEALKTILPALRAQGYEFVTLTELFERKGETPKRNILYSQVTKYPCGDYELYQEVSSDREDRIVLDAALLEQLGDSYAVEVSYSGNPHPPVVALQKWTDGETIWYPVQPVYDNGEKACILAQDILAGLAELGKGYSELDRVCISTFSGDIVLSDAKILVRAEPPAFLPGDVNDDGVLDAADAAMLQTYLLGSGTLTNPEAADLNEDGKINAFDLAYLKRTLLEKRQTDTDQ